MVLFYSMVLPFASHDPWEGKGAYQETLNLHSPLLFLPPGKGLTPPPGDESACGVCMDRAADIQITSCTHALCYRCALKICTNTSAGPTCPFCRTPLDGFERACPWGAGRGRGDAATPTPPPPQAGGVSDTAAP